MQVYSEVYTTEFHGRIPVKPDFVAPDFQGFFGQ